MLAQVSSSRGFNQRSLLPFTFPLHGRLRFNLSSPMDSASPTHLPSFSTSSLSLSLSPSPSPSPSPPPPAKRVGAHNGGFHCDEALGYFMIRLSDKFSNAETVRTRDPQVLEGLDVVLDVGGFYNPSRDPYDHHQKGFQEVCGDGFATKLSNAGLVYKHFGKEIIAKELQDDEGHPDMHGLFLAVYESFMEYDTDHPPRYVNNTHLSSRVGRFNLDWSDPDQSSEKENEAFQQEMALAGSEFLNESVRFHAKSWLPARSIVMDCLSARWDIDPSGEIMVLNRFCPDERSKSWQVRAVAVASDIFESRKALASQWRGLRDEELSKESGIPGCVFIHMRGFLGENQTYEGAPAMARARLKL